MERERPEYLRPIKPSRWSFPWLGFIGIVVLALAVFGIKQHLDTQAAWNKRFIREPGAVDQQAKTTPTVAEMRAEAAREDVIAEIRLRRERAEREATKTREKWRCINHTLFRKIDGGWENVPGESC